ncbi:MAG: amino acid ABC transporter substrate-binding protein [Deltaproteobacteria bacterium]|nr:amino acid ABC transporter substrate-binding protein [Deltaproteobacteria bacterium]
MKIKLIIFWLFFFTVIDPAWAINIKINDSRKNNFFMESLKWILKKSGQEYKIITTKHPVSSQKRKIVLVKNGEIDIIYAGTSIELEKELLPIRFPVTRGFNGRRIFIINKNYQFDYNMVNNLNALKNHTGVQGLGWGNKQILEYSGLKQVENVYDEIFRSINAGNRSYFPRAVTEVFSEYNNRKAKMPNLVIDKKILLVYKYAVLYFVNPSNTELAEMVKTGFINGYKDGSYIRYFYNHPYIKSSLKHANLKKRIKIEIDNPFLSSETNAIPKKYWHQN